MQTQKIRPIVLASANKGKLAEFAHAFEESAVVFTPMADAGFVGDIDETGLTYAENALIKARAVSRAVGLPAVADDSGIEIDALPGELGVKTARYGAGRSSAAVNDELLERLAGVETPRRGCRYVAAVAYVDAARGIEKVFHGVCEGRIHTERAGSAGFGHDPIFFLPDRGRAMAEIPMEEKNRISHRAKAIAGLKEYLS